MGVLRIPLVMLPLALAADAAAQGPNHSSALGPGAGGTPERVVRAEPTSTEDGLERGLAVLASLAAPGAGQAMLGQRRWVLYVALEGWTLLRWLDRRSDGRGLAEDYRDLAWNVARRISVGPRRDGDFEYYESLTKFAASGAFDLDPERSGIQPETDPSTFNGDRWELAKAIFLPGGRGEPGTPAFERALAFYREGAIPPEFAWAWGENGLEQRAFAELIERSDDALRDAGTFLGILLANHLLSAVDALIAARLLGEGDGASPVRLGGELDEDRSGALRWTVRVSVAWPWGSP